MSSANDSKARGVWLAAFAAACCVLARPATAELPTVYERETSKPIADVLDDAEFAIVERNFRITGSLHIGRAIRERDGDGFPDYEVILFCNLAHARAMLELEPQLVNFCPGRITVRGAGNQVIVSAPLLPQNTGHARGEALLAEINGLIREIVDYAAETWMPNLD